ncbi:carbohydrate ABC transporter membrane protein 1, CUT1 family (TC 3.A.1.1.-) [Yoonia tamlensis]|uniref:Carbohydrate ABC transporter membrane protein 1, CUT1 family (TC 3.A.1.1.-) n=1 Tax=Yoonia tamlensis TaxID=390270 RepID=A0A1I6HDU0_9RHOB|nr:sugar ABC transporter permease [Yoonia tamlensis]SFR52500.1 carbohydrate ABC transporter membrane protein 1, CUT1 family (TC 3.A.1.1.-) [Yoonia tamlensis]
MSSRTTKLLFMLPALIVLAVFFVYPIALTFYYSFTDFTGVGTPEYAGLKNYDRIMSRSRYPEALKVTILFTLIVVTVQTLAGLFIATLLQRLPAVRNFARAALFTPAMMSFVIVGYLWQFIYSPFNGGLNALLTSVGLESLTRAWLGDPSTALFAIAIAHVWMFTGYTTAIFLAGYANIPGDIEEAGKLEGANSLQRFWYLELPLLAPSVTINVMLSTIGTLKTFELPFIMTKGGPDGATRTLSLEIIENLFGAYKFGFASSLSIVMLVIVIIVAFVQNKFLRGREDNMS